MACRVDGAEGEEGGEAEDKVESTLIMLHDYLTTSSIFKAEQPTQFNDPFHLTTCHCPLIACHPNPQS